MILLLMMMIALGALLWADHRAKDNNADIHRLIRRMARESVRRMLMPPPCRAARWTGRRWE